MFYGKKCGFRKGIRIIGIMSHHFFDFTRTLTSCHAYRPVGTSWAKPQMVKVRCMMAYVRASKSLTGKSSMPLQRGKVPFSSFIYLSRQLEYYNNVENIQVFVVEKKNGRKGKETSIFLPKHDRE